VQDRHQTTSLAIPGAETKPAEFDVSACVKQLGSDEDPPQTAKFLAAASSFDHGVRDGAGSQCDGAT
jgi:hypothetical protein